MKSGKNFGICKLTGNKGKFVKSHIIPKSLTKPFVPGQYFIEAGEGKRPTRTFSSWYDTRLVTQDGEDILSELDAWGINELRKQKLIWSSWGPMLQLNSTDWTEQPFSDLDGNYLSDQIGQGFRTLNCTNSLKFRLFFLSILWRAAASELSTFRQILLPTDDLFQLKEMIINKDSLPIEFYPITLQQLYQRGPIHNFGALKINQANDLEKDGVKYNRTGYRFYFDGLIVFFHDHSKTKNNEYDYFNIGAAQEMGVQTIPTFDSFQVMNLLKHQKESWEQWPIDMTKLHKISSPTS